jgi:hypothetical protein
MDVQYIELWLGTAEKLPRSANDKIRGYVGNKFADDSVFHNHDRNGADIYRYPLVQYKVIDGTSLILGIAGGMNALWKIFDEVSMVVLGDYKVEIFDKKSLIKQGLLRTTDNRPSYSFLTPWLALNQKNYEKYVILEAWTKRKAMLESILVGNLISMSKSLGYTVPAPITARLGKMKEVKTSLKGTPMLGFLGEFSVNFDIPDYWGIGKSVSRGFGTVKRIGGAT